MFAVPEARRLATAVFLCGAGSSPLLGSLLVTGAAAAGIRSIASSFHGPGLAGNAHPLVGYYDETCRHIGSATAYGPLPALDLPTIEMAMPNSWAIAVANAPRLAVEDLEDVADENPDAPTLIVFHGPGGFCLWRCPDPIWALEALLPLCDMPAMPQGTPDTAVAAAGIALHQVLCGGERLDPNAGADGQPVLVAAYLLNREPRERVAKPKAADMAQLVEAIRPDPGLASLAGKKVQILGGGALGNLALLVAALQGLASIHLYDDDDVAESNLNRQVLLLGGVGRPKVEMLAEAINQLSPSTQYVGHKKRINSPADFEDLDQADVLFALPDNDTARILADEAAYQAGVLLGVAGSSPLGCQEAVRRPGDSCLRCLGVGRTMSAPASCALGADDAIVSTNMVAAGLVVSEMRMLLSGRQGMSIAFDGHSTGYTLMRTPSQAECPHRTRTAAT
jgi:hypothetical protein